MWPTRSRRTAIRSAFSRRSTMPRNFNLLGGGPVGGGAPIGPPARAPGNTGGGGPVAARALVLNLNKLRSAFPGFGLSADNVVKRTSGASGPLAARGPFGAPLPAPAGGAP